jgi:hypothetical protein
MMRTATAIVHADPHVTALDPDARTDHSLAWQVGRVALVVAIAAVMFVLVEPLTLPWIATAYTGLATVLGTTFVANR